MVLRERNGGVSGIYLHEDKESCERRRSSNAIVSPNLTFQTGVTELFNEQCRCSFVVNLLVDLHKCSRSTSHSGNFCSQLPIFIAARNSSSTAHFETASIIAKQQWDMFSRHHWQSQLNTSSFSLLPRLKYSSFGFSYDCTSGTSLRIGDATSKRAAAGFCAAFAPSGTYFSGSSAILGHFQA